MPSNFLAISAPYEVQGTVLDRNVQFAGNLDVVSPTDLSGWVVRLNQPSKATIVTARIGDITLATATTSYFREDVSSTLIAEELKLHRLKTGFVLIPHIDGIAELQAVEDQEEPLELHVSIRCGRNEFFFEHGHLPKPAAEWLEFFSTDADSLASGPHAKPIRNGEFWYSSIADFETFPISDDIADLVNSPAFDAAAYVTLAKEQNIPLAKVGLSRANPAEILSHYCTFGVAAGLPPSPKYALDLEFLKTQVPDGDTCVLPFLRSWALNEPIAPNREAHRLGLEFHTNFSKTEPDASYENGLLAWAASINLMPVKDEMHARFLTQLGQIREAKNLSKMPIAHILTRGSPELTDDVVASATKTIREAGGFDQAYYLANNRDVIGSNLDPVEHYVRYGEREGRNPSPGFNSEFYLTSNADVCAVVPNGFAHFLTFGRSEGRLGVPPTLGRDADCLGEPILLVGHSAMLAGAERILLDLTKWISKHTLRPITVYLMTGGPLTSEFCKYADVIAAPHDPMLDLALRMKVMRRSWGLVYLNTVVAGGFLQSLEEDILRPHKIIGHIHEMKNVLEEHELALAPLKEHCCHVISASPSSTTSLIEDFGFSQNLISTVPAFIDPVVTSDDDPAVWRDWARRELGLGDTAKVVMGCGSIYWRKGTDIFVDTAIAVNKDRRPEDQIHFIWVGDGEDRKKLEGVAEAAGIGHLVRFTGLRTNASALLGASDLFFLPSREDPFPLVCLEAAQHLSPTLFVGSATGIGRFVCPPKDLNHGPAGGWELPDFSPEGAAAIITEAFKNPADTAARGIAARDRLMALYTSDRNCQLIFSRILSWADLAPVISVIVPNYNHAAYLPERLQSILSQTMKDYEIIVLDDCSTDDSLDVIERELDGYAMARVIANDTNSGGVFYQWKKGINAARGMYTWIAESDDWCNDVFLERLCAKLTKPGVVVATGKTVPFFNGNLDPAPMQAYLNSQCPGMFDAPFELDGDVFVNRGMGAACLLVNASGLLMRSDLVRAFVEKGLDYKMAGDWVIYLHILRYGRVVYEPEAENYFRRHATSTVHEIEGTALYFAERKRIASLVYDLFSVGSGLHRRIRASLDREVKRFEHKSPDMTLADVAPDRLPTLRSRGKVAFYVHGMTFSKGGIERLAAQLANHLASIGFEVHILCRHWGTDESIYPLHSSVRIAQVFSEDWLEASIDSVHRYLVKYGIETFVPMLSEWLFTPIIEAGQRAGVSIIASEHNDPWQIEEEWWSHDERQETFAKVDVIHLLSKNFVPSIDEAHQSKVAVIPNGVDMSIYRPADEDTGRTSKRIVAAGRLVAQKRMDILIDAFVQSGIGNDGWTLDIYGHGSDHGALEAQIIAADATDAITLCGVKEDMVPVFQNATLTVLASEFEGFGIVAVESLACGTPVIAFDDCNGLNEIIQDGISGVLVDTSDVIDPASRVTALANTFVKVENSPELVAHMSDAARLRSEHFSLNSFLQSWESVLGDLSRARFEDQ